MKNSMILIGKDREKQFNICPGCMYDSQTENADLGKVIPTFYSAKHAEDEGWRKTNSRVFSQHGNWVWVCPNCVKEFERLR